MINAERAADHVLSRCTWRTDMRRCVWITPIEMAIILTDDKQCARVFPQLNRKTRRTMICLARTVQH